MTTYSPEIEAGLDRIRDMMKGNFLDDRNTPTGRAPS